MSFPPLFLLSFSIKETSKVTDSALEGAVVRAIFVEQALILGAVHHVLSRCILGLHVGVLRCTGPVNQVFARLQSGFHGNAWEQIIIFGLKSTLHSRLVFDRWLVEIEGAVTHESFPLLGLELVVACNFEHDWVLSPGWLAHCVLARISRLSVSQARVLFTLGLLLGEHIRKLTVKDGISRLLTQLCLNLGSVLHYFSTTK